MPTITLPDLLNHSSSLSVPNSARLQSLYTFTSSQRLSNVAGYEANIRWWAGVLKECMREGLSGGDRLLLRVDEIVGKLEWNSTLGAGTVLSRPKGFGGVLTSLTLPTPPSSLPALLPLSIFLTSLTPLNQPPSLTSRFIARPLWWALGKINPLGGGGDIKVESEDVMWKALRKRGTYVHLELSDEVATNIILVLTSHPPALLTSRLFTAQTFQQSPYALLNTCLPSHFPPDRYTEEGRLSIGDCKVILRYLERDKGMMVADEAQEVYKLVQSPEEVETATVTEADRGTIAIMTTLTKLENQIAEINDQIISVRDKAAAHLKLNQKNVALSYLRSRKHLEGVLEKRVASAEQLKTVLRSIEQAHGDVEIMQAYETSSATIKSILSHPSLQLSHVDSTMDSLAEALADQKEIDAAIQTGGKAAVGAASLEEPDDAELEKELEQLMLDDKVEVAKKEEQKVEKVETKPTATTPGAAKEEKPSPKSTKAPDWAAIDEAARQRKEDEAIRASTERLQKEQQRQALTAD